MKVSKTLILISAAFVLAGGSIFAQNSPAKGTMKCGKDFRGPHREQMMSRLNLTDEQKEAFKKIHTELAKETLPLKNEIREKKAHLQTLQTAEKADLNAINKTIDEIADLKKQVAKDHAKSLQKIRNLLTDEQRVIFDSRPHGKGFGHGNGRRMGMDQRHQMGGPQMDIAPGSDTQD